MEDPREAMLPLVRQLRAYAYALAQHQDLADDLVQDTLMLALNSWHRFEPGTNLKGWLFEILRNRFLSVISRKHVRSEVASESLEHLASVPAFQEKAIEVHEFKQAFARLSPTHREVLVLHAVHGLPYEEIAALCGCEIGTVKSRINRARNLLKGMLLGELAPGQPVPTPRFRPTKLGSTARRAKSLQREDVTLAAEA
jgi:RNA polymerase sigma-70 factor (ECF subfamily)